MNEVNGVLNNIREVVHNVMEGHAATGGMDHTNTNNNINMNMNNNHHQYTNIIHHLPKANIIASHKQINNNNNIPPPPPLPISPQNFHHPNHSYVKYTVSELALIFCTGFLCLLCCILCTFQFINHLKSWRKPGLQKCYLRIILVAPIYATFSWFAVLSSRNSGIFDLARSIYETYVLYTFFALMILSAGGERYVKKYWKRNCEVNEVPIICTLCPPCEEEGLLSWKLFPIKSTSLSLHIWKFCFWQFMFIKPVAAIVTAISEHLHVAIYTDPYVKPIALLSVTIAMLGLLNVYLSLAKHPKVKILKAEGKFIVIKLAIFLTVWQEMILHILVGKGVIHSPYCYLIGKRSGHCLYLTGFATPSAQRGVRTVATLIIFEMFALSILMLYYFPYSDICLGKLKIQKDNNNNMNRNLIDFDNFLRVLCFGDILCNLEDSGSGSYLPPRKRRRRGKKTNHSKYNNQSGNNNNTITSGHDGMNMIVDVPSPIMERVVDVLNDSGEEEEEEEEC